MSGKSILEVNGISKTFGGIHALSNVDLSIREGETLGLVGENGAGKSTLMRILSGIIPPDEGSGSVKVDGEEVLLSSPHTAQSLGIGMIPQELVLAGQLSVTENIFLGHERFKPGHLLDKSKMDGETKSLLDDMECRHIRPDAAVRFLSKADQQLVAIARRLVQGGRVFIMDEPTAPLTEKETRNLFSIIRERLNKKGYSVVFISHRLEEVLEICDRITVLRDGKLAAQIDDPAQTTKADLVYHMVGSEVADEFPKVPASMGEPLIEVEGLRYPTNQGILTPEVSFTVRKGEVVAVTGLVGVGKTELGQTLLGLREQVSGRITVRGSVQHLRSAVSANRLGFGYVSEDRRGEGLVLGMPTLHNMTLNSLEQVTWKNLVLRKTREREIGLTMARRLRMKDQYLTMPARQLSGGNQQKAVIVRQMLGDAELIIFDEPTKGIDVGAKSEIARLIGELSKQGKGVLLLSSEPREALGISDTLFVLTHDVLEGPFSRGELSYERLMAIELGLESAEGA